MAPSNPSRQPQPTSDIDSEPEMLAAEDALEEVPEDGDIAMDSDSDGDGGMEDDDEPEEITLHNDSVAYFDAHKHSIFAIAQHPTIPTLIATGGSEGEADDAPGKGYVFDTSSIPARPLLPQTYSGEATRPPTQLSPSQTVFEIDGHTDSINALTFTLPNGDFLLSGGLDGRLRAYAVSTPSATSSSSPAPPVQIRFVAEAQEVPEINWIRPCPAGGAHPNVFALGASDGSVWVYQVQIEEDTPLTILQSYFLHTGSATAGCWTRDGELLASVSEDGSLFVFDVFGTAAMQGVRTRDNAGTTTVVALTEADARFAVDGGLYSVATSPTGTFLAVGGAGGAIKIVGLPRLGGGGDAGARGGGRQGQQKAAAGSKGGRKGGAAGSSSGGADAGQAQAGQILASLHAQGDGVETLSFSEPGGAGSGGGGVLLAAGSVDGSIAVYDAQRSFQVRRLVSGAHGDLSVVKVEFVRASPHLLTSCGMDGVVRRWDVRGTTTTGGGGGGVAALLQQQQQQQQRRLQQQQQELAQAQGAAVAGLVKEWRGHRGDGEGGGVFDFVQGDTGERIVTAGDDGVALVFEA